MTHNEAKPRRVLILYNQTERLSRGEERDLIAERGVIRCAAEVAEALASVGYTVKRLPLHGDVELALKPYCPSEWTVFNLAEGVDGRMFEEARIAWALEVMGYTFTGATGDALAITSHKARAKSRLQATGIPTPNWAVVRPGETPTGRILARIGLPAIVKPVAEDASIGLDYAAVVHSEEELQARVRYITERYSQMAIVEKFIEGREFNVALWGDPLEILPLAEIDFGQFACPEHRIVTYSAKWEEDTFEYHNTPAICPAQIDTHMADTIRDTALRAWEALECNGYGRVDIRLSDQEEPYVLEVNCNPDISSDAGFFRSAKAAGHTYASMAQFILEAAHHAHEAYDRYSPAQ